MFLAEAQPAQETVRAAPAAERDSRESFIPGDPLGGRFGVDGSIADSASQDERLAAIARSAERVPPPAEEHESQAGVTIGILLTVAGLALVALQIYRRRGRFNFAGQGNNR